MGKRAHKVSKWVKKALVKYAYIEGDKVEKDETLLPFFTTAEDLLAQAIANRTECKGVMVIQVTEVNEKYELPLNEYMERASLVNTVEGKVHVLRGGYD